MSNHSELDPRNALLLFDSRVQTWKQGLTSHLASSKVLALLLSEEAVALPDGEFYCQQACEIALSAVSHGMRHQVDVGTVFTGLLISGIARHANWRILVENEDHRYAILSCLFWGVDCGLPDADFTRWNTILGEWLPQTKDIVFDSCSTGAILARKVFDRHWLTLYGMDSAVPDWRAMDVVLLSHPPLADTYSKQKAPAVILPEHFAVS